MRLWLDDDQELWASPSFPKRDNAEVFGMPDEKQGLLAGEEWQDLPRGWRVREMGIAAGISHDRGRVETSALILLSMRNADVAFSQAC